MAAATSGSILVVDDDPDIVQLIAAVLHYAGYRVIQAQSGEAGFASATQQPPDLVIADVRLPGIDGYTLCRNLRRHPATRHVPILMLTADDDIKAKIEGFEAGANDYLTKPFQPQELPYRIRNLLGRTPVATPDTAPTKARGRLTAVFGAKGGVGKTTLAVNLALGAQTRLKRRVVLVDGDLFFGDIGVHLNLVSTHTLRDLARVEGSPDDEMVRRVLTPHPSGLRVLTGPPRPEEAEMVTSAHLKGALDTLCESFEEVIVDCPSNYDERTLVILESADQVLLVITPEIGPIKNTSYFLELAQNLGLRSEQIVLVLNRANSNVGLDAATVERTLKHRISFQIVSGGRMVVLSVNRGSPLIVSAPKEPFAQQVAALSQRLFAQVAAPAAAVRR